MTVERRRDRVSAGVVATLADLPVRHTRRPGRSEMAFDLPRGVPSGRTIWRVGNAGATVERVQTVLDAALRAERAGGVFEEQTAPPALGPAWAGWPPHLVAGIGVLSPQRAVAAQIDFAPGTHAAVCFIPCRRPASAT